MASKVYNPHIQVLFDTTIRVTTPSDADSGVVYDTLKQCVNNEYGYLVDDPEMLSFSVVDNLAEVDYVETLIENLYIHETSWNCMTIDGEPYTLYWLRSDSNQDFRISVMVPYSGIVGDDDVKMWKIAKEMIRRDYERKVSENNLITVFTT